MYQKKCWKSPHLVAVFSSDLSMMPETMWLHQVEGGILLFKIIENTTTAPFYKFPVKILLKILRFLFINCTVSSVWDNANLNNLPVDFITEELHTTDCCELVASDKLWNKFKQLKANGSLQVSVLSGLVKIESSAFLQATSIRRATPGESVNLKFT